MIGSLGVSKIARKCLGNMISGYVKLVYKTGNISSDPENPKEYSANLGPTIIAAWHGQNMILPAFWHHQHPLEILVSRHPDAEVGATAYNNLGLIHKQRCDWSRSLEYLQVASSLQAIEGEYPERRAGMHNLGLVHYHMGHWDRAREIDSAPSKHSRALSQ